MGPGASSRITSSDLPGRLNSEVRLFSLDAQQPPSLQGENTLHMF